MNELARRARALVESAGTGTLCTLSKRQAGFPFGSLVAYALDESGRPLFLLSRLAVHTRNLAADDRAALLVTAVEPGRDLLDSPRVTLIGTVGLLPEVAAEPGRRIYLARHANAAEWAGFGDFGLYRMEVAEAYFVGGFGSMGWIGW